METMSFATTTTRTATTTPTTTTTMMTTPVSLCAIPLSPELAFELEMRGDTEG